MLAAPPPMTALVLLLTGAALAPGLQRSVPTPLLPGRWSAAACSSRAPVVRCQEEIPASALENIPPAAMADAWMRDEKARELGEALKGCSVYLVGLGSPKLEAVGRIFSRRLPKYRYYSVPELMCSTYATLSGGEEGAAAPMMSDLYEAEPMDDVTSLARAITDQVQQYTRAVVRSWEGSVSTSDFAVMQQGIVVRVVGMEPEPSSGAVEEAREGWAEKHSAADVTVSVETEAPTDDIVFAVVKGLLEFIEKNPGKSDEWKSKADALQAEGWSVDN